MKKELCLFLLPLLLTVTGCNSYSTHVSKSSVPMEVAVKKAVLSPNFEIGERINFEAEFTPKDLNMIVRNGKVVPGYYVSGVVIGADSTKLNAGGESELSQPGLLKIIKQRALFALCEKEDFEYIVYPEYEVTVEISGGDIKYRCAITAFTATISSIETIAYKSDIEDQLNGIHNAMDEAETLLSRKQQLRAITGEL